MSDWAVWSVVEQSAKEIGIERFGAHDLRRACAKLYRKNGADLEQSNSISDADTNAIYSLTTGLATWQGLISQNGNPRLGAVAGS